MPGYFGTEQQMALQAAADDAYAWLYETPGACHPGRFLGTDDAERLGWDTIFKLLDRDRVFGFRMVPSHAVSEVTEKLSERGYRIDFWDVFVATRSEAEAPTQSVLAKRLPDGFEEMQALKDSEHPDTRKVQAFLAANEIAPFSGSMLTGEFGSATTVVILDQEDEIAAAAHGYYPHNAHGQYHRSMWGGMVAVSSAHRGAGLGKYVNARMVANCFELLGAQSLHELVAAANIPSRKMVEACGLQLDPSLKSGIAVTGDGRFTS